MNYFFITGSSEGLGKHLSELLLNDENNFVYGFARKCSIQHRNYVHTTIDFSDLSATENYQFPDLIAAEKISLINNAGIVGDVKHVGKIDVQKIIACYNINLLSPTIFTNNFVQKYSDTSIEKLIINISSGAGRSPIDGWSVYCSTKAGLDMFTQVLNEEIKIDNKHFKVLSLAPGIIDTGMQVQIRSSAQEDFSNIERFIEYKKAGDLTKPEITAQQVMEFIKNPNLTTNVLCSVRDLTE